MPMMRAIPCGGRLLEDGRDRPLVVIGLSVASFVDRAKKRAVLGQIE